MIRISKLTDYALLIMTALAKDPQALMSASMLANHLQLALPTASKILKILQEKQLVISTRGAEGGYRLARLANAISLADIIAAMEGHLALTECCQCEHRCTLSPVCTLRDNWIKINGLIHEFLAKLTILDMLEPLTFSASNPLLAGMFNRE